MAISIAMMPITTRSSMRVKARAGAGVGGAEIVLQSFLRSDFDAPQAGSEVLRRPGSDAKTSGSSGHLRAGVCGAATVMNSLLDPFKDAPQRPRAEQRNLAKG
jgi:hypothetical protein